MFQNPDAKEIASKKDEIAADIQKNPVILYMKGTKEMPQCGFSARAVSLISKYRDQFETRNVLEDDVLRAAIKEYSDWPTIPQLYVNKEFIGGSDIIAELDANGELKSLLSA